MLSSRRSSRRIRRILGGAMVSFNLFAFSSNISLAGNTFSNSSVNYELKDRTLRISGQGVIKKGWAKKLPKYDEILKKIDSNPTYYLEKIKPRMILLEAISKKKDLNPVELVVLNSFEHVIIESGITELREGAFENCIKLKDINVSNTVKRVGKRAFDNCFALLEIEIPSAVEEIGDEVFRSCYSLSQCRILGRIKKMGNGVFKYCKSLVKIAASYPIEEAGENVFEFCNSLMHIPEIKKRGPQAYRGCNSLIGKHIKNSGW